MEWNGDWNETYSRAAYNGDVTVIITYCATYNGDVTVIITYCATYNGDVTDITTYSRATYNGDVIDIITYSRATYKGDVTVITTEEGTKVCCVCIVCNVPQLMQRNTVMYTTAVDAKKHRDAHNQWMQRNTVMHTTSGCKETP